MPSVGAAFLKFAGYVVGIGSATGATALAVNVARFAIVSAATGALAKRALRRGKPGGLSTRDHIIRSATAPMTVVYGETVTSGVLVYANSRQSRQDEQIFDLHMAIAHAAHECEDLTSLWYDDAALTEASNFSWTSGGGGASGRVSSHAKWGPVNSINSVELERHLGTSSQTVDSELDASYDDIGTADRGRNICYTVHVFRFHANNQDKFTGPPSNIRALVKGKNNIYDPALDASPGADPDNATFQAWTANPILCVADYMRTYMGIANARFDWSDIQTEAAICDATVPINTSSPQGTEARYTCNGVLSLADTHRGNIERLLSSCNGFVVKTDGKWQIKAGAYQTPTVTISDDDIIGEPTWKGVLPARERFNTVHAHYISKDDEYREVEATEIQDATFLSRDNSVELVKTMSLPFTNHETEAQRIMFKTLDQGNQQGILTVPLTWAGLELAPMTGVQLTYAPYSFTNKVFRCLGVSIGQGEAPVVALLKEDASTAWDDPLGSDYTTRTPAGVVTPADPIVYNDLPEASDLYAYFPLNVLGVAENRAAASSVPFGTVGGSPTLASGVTDTAYRFDANTENVTLMSHADATTFEASAWSWSIWFRSDSATGNSTARIITRDFSDYWAIYINQQEAQGSQTITMGGVSLSVTSGALTGTAKNGWNHTAFCVDASGNWTWYLNGVVQGVGTGYTGSTSSPRSSRPIVLAVNTEATPNTANPFDGRICFVRFYTKELLPVEVFALYRNPAGDSEGIGLAKVGTNVVDEDGTVINNLDLLNIYSGSSTNLVPDANFQRILDDGFTDPVGSSPTSGSESPQWGTARTWFRDKTDNVEVVAGGEWSNAVIRFSDESGLPDLRADVYSSALIPVVPGETLHWAWRFSEGAGYDGEMRLAVRRYSINKTPIWVQKITDSASGSPASWQTKTGTWDVGTTTHYIRVQIEQRNRTVSPQAFVGSSPRVFGRVAWVWFGRGEYLSTAGADWKTNLTNIPGGIQEIYYQGSPPTPSPLPTAGDMWIDSGDNKLYRYNGSSFVEIQDDGIGQAIADAAGAQGTADNKIYVFAQAGEPTDAQHPEGQVDVGDLWIETDAGNRMWRADPASPLTWTLYAPDYRYLTNIPGDLQRIFYQASTPTPSPVPAVGDLWIDSDDNKLYRHNGSSFVQIQDDGISTAITNAATAQGTADNKVYVFAQAGEPTDAQHPEGQLDIGDLWIETDQGNRIWRCTTASPIAWTLYATDYSSLIDGSGIQPENNATVGATWNTDITNQPDIIGSNLIPDPNFTYAAGIANGGPHWGNETSSITFETTGGEGSPSGPVLQFLPPSPAQQGVSIDGGYIPTRKDERFYARIRYKASSDWDAVGAEWRFEIAEYKEDFGSSLSWPNMITADDLVKDNTWRWATGSVAVISDNTYWMRPQFYSGNGAIIWDVGSIVVSHVEVYRFEPDATVGADWNTNLTNIPGDLQLVFYQASMPTPSPQATVGDLWIDSDDNKLYRHNGATFVEIQDDGISTAITNAATAQGTADNKVYVFAQAGQPTDGQHPEGQLEIGDLWIETDQGNRIWRCTTASPIAFTLYATDYSSLIDGSGIQPENNATAGAGLSGEVPFANGNFELGDIRWTKEGSWQITEVGAGTAHQGTWAASSGATSGSAAIRNSVGYPCEAGDRFMISGYANTSGGAATSGWGLRISWLDKGQAEVITSAVAVGSHPTVWTHIHGIKTAPTTSPAIHFARLEGYYLSQTAGTLYLDDAMMVPIPDASDSFVLTDNIVANGVSLQGLADNIGGRVALTSFTSDPTAYTVIVTAPAVTPNSTDDKLLVTFSGSFYPVGAGTDNRFELFLYDNGTSPHTRLWRSMDDTSGNHLRKDVDATSDGMMFAFQYVDDRGGTDSRTYTLRGLYFGSTGNRFVADPVIDWVLLKR